MSEKRRDNRGRILHNGENQRQDGRYAYKYKDLNGEYKFVYSWRLDKNDRTPAGRARELSLREKERQIQQDLFKKIVPNGGYHGHLHAHGLRGCLERTAETGTTGFSKRTGPQIGQNGMIWRVVRQKTKPSILQKHNIRVRKCRENPSNP